jgi:hypothetical protein
MSSPGPSEITRRFPKPLAPRPESAPEHPPADKESGSKPDGSLDGHNRSEPEQ